MNANDLFPESKYLKSEDVETAGGEMELTIKAVGRKEYTDDNKGGKKEVKGELSFVETDKHLSINVTNTRILVAMFGGENIDTAWVGKKITLWVDPFVEFQGKTVKGLRIRLSDKKTDAITAFWEKVKSVNLPREDALKILKENNQDFVAAAEAIVF